MGKLLIIDDDILFGRALTQALESQQWTCEVATTGSEGLELLNKTTYDFILLDWNLPDINGYEICRKFRASGGQAPIIFVTGRQAISDIEAGLEAGADDYVTKPLDCRELIARMRAVQRRPPIDSAPTLSAKGFQLDATARIISSGTKRVQLSFTEANILQLLLSKKNRFFSGAQIFQSLWPSDTQTSDDTVRVHVRLLRRRLATIGAENLIKTIRGAGYIIDDPQEPQDRFGS